MSDAIIGPGGRIGILGGGQLGRMIAMAAARLGLSVHIYAPEAEPPAGQVADQITQAGWEDEAALPHPSMW
jgi:5-(carboxyamino)imidazole ribonucleotide synthase